MLSSKTLWNMVIIFTIRFNPLSANFTKWSIILKQLVGNLPTNCLSVFGHFVGLVLEGLSCRLSQNLRGGYHHLTAKGLQRSKKYNMILPDQFNPMYSCVVDMYPDDQFNLIYNCVVDMYPDRITLLQRGFNCHLVYLKLFSARVKVARTRNFKSSEPSKTISNKANIRPCFSTPWPQEIIRHNLER